MNIAAESPAPKTGTYYLVDRYGAPTGCFARFDEGEPLPPIGVNGYGRLIWRLVDDEAADEA
jgi:hypothetical protein